MEKAAQRGIEVGLCGEAGGNHRFATLFIGMGIKNFSMSPRLASRVHKKILETS